MKAGCYAVKETAVEVLYLQTKEYQRLLANHQNQEQGREGRILPIGFKASMVVPTTFYQHLN